MTALRKFVLLATLLAATALTVSAQVLPSSYTPLNPCAVFDSTSGSQLTAGTTYFDQLRGTCNIPSTANAVALAIIASGASGAGEAIVWDSGTSEPTAVASMTFRGSGSDSSFTIVRLCHPSEECSGVDVHIKVRTNNSHLKLIAVGYFEPLP